MTHGTKAEGGGWVGSHPPPPPPPHTYTYTHTTVCRRDSKQTDRSCFLPTPHSDIMQIECDQLTSRDASVQLNSQLEQL